MEIRKTFGAFSINDFLYLFENTDLMKYSTVLYNSNDNIGMHIVFNKHIELDPNSSFDLLKILIKGMGDYFKSEYTIELMYIAIYLKELLDDREQQRISIFNYSFKHDTNHICDEVPQTLIHRIFSKLPFVS
jgi:hypothetical protein